MKTETEHWTPIDTFKREERTQPMHSFLINEVKMEDEWPKKPLLPSDLNMDYNAAVKSGLKK